MKRRDIVLGIIFVVVVGGLLYMRNKQRGEEMRVPEDQIASSGNTERKIEEKFNTDIPDDAEKAELKDVSEGDGSAIATRKSEDGKTQIAVLADLPDPESGKKYYVWVEKDDEFISLGGMRLAKGGWVFDQTSSKDLTEFDKVVISLEGTVGKSPDKRVLEGNF